MTNQPAWMAVLEASKALSMKNAEEPYDHPRAERMALNEALDAWRDDTSQGPEGYPMPDEPGTATTRSIRAVMAALDDLSRISPKPPAEPVKE